MRKPALLVIVAALAVSACRPFDGTNAGTTDIGGFGGSTSTIVPGGDRPGPAFVDDVEFLFLESHPVRVRATVRGSVPTPCHEPVWTIEAPVGGPEVTLNVFARTDSDASCAQVLEPFAETIDIGAFPTGHYTLIVNGEPYPFTV